MAEDLHERPDDPVDDDTSRPIDAWLVRTTAAEWWAASVGWRAS